jgi:hypothetical protein
LWPFRLRFALLEYDGNAVFSITGSAWKIMASVIFEFTSIAVVGILLFRRNIPLRRFVRVWFFAHLVVMVRPDVQSRFIGTRGWG